MSASGKATERSGRIARKARACALSLVLACSMVPVAASADPGPLAAGSAAMAPQASSGKAEITKSCVTAKDIAWTGKARAAKVSVVSPAGKKLKKGRDYTLVIRNSKGKKVARPKAVGAYKATVTGAGSYTGTVTKSFKVAKRAKLSASMITVKNLPYATGWSELKEGYGARTRDGNQWGGQSAKVTVKRGGKTLVQGTDYTVKVAYPEVYDMYKPAQRRRTQQDLAWEPYKYIAYVTGKGLYKGTVCKAFQVKATTKKVAGVTYTQQRYYTQKKAVKKVKYVAKEGYAYDKVLYSAADLLVCGSAHWSDLSDPYTLYAPVKVADEPVYQWSTGAAPQTARQVGTRTVALHSDATDTSVERIAVPAKVAEGISSRHPGAGAEEIAGIVAGIWGSEVGTDRLGDTESSYNEWWDGFEAALSVQEQYAALDRGSLAYEELREWREKYRATLGYGIDYVREYSEGTLGVPLGELRGALSEDGFYWRYAQQCRGGDQLSAYGDSKPLGIYTGTERATVKPTYAYHEETVVTDTWVNRWVKYDRKEREASTDYWRHHTGLVNSGLPAIKVS